MGRRPLVYRRQILTSKVGPRAVRDKVVFNLFRYQVNQLLGTKCVFRCFVKLKNFQKSEKNSEVGGWVKPQLGFLFLGEILCFVCVVYFVVHVSKKKKLDRRVGGEVRTIGFLDFF